LPGHPSTIQTNLTISTIKTNIEGIMEKKTGTLYGIGVGPGDPDLITLKAANILNQVDIVFAAASTKNNHSLAVNIARPHISDNAAVKMLRFPMSTDKNKTREAWRDHSQTIIAELEKGKNVAFLTLGGLPDIFDLRVYFTTYSRNSSPYRRSNGSGDHLLPGFSRQIEYAPGGR
jgi:hypothetical protein